MVTIKNLIFFSISGNIPEVIKIILDYVTYFLDYITNYKKNAI